MKKSILNLNGVKILSKDDLKFIKGAGICCSHGRM